MCGIFGVLGKKEDIDINKVYDDLYHRGPDNQSYNRYKDILFIHTRLAIIDLMDSSNQPMESDDIILVFNGEVYNYLELINEYNLVLNTKSDTEVIIKLYKLLGIKFVNKLNGIFALALYDKKKDKLFLTRDRFGKKPLYYKLDNGVFYFSSEIKAIISQTGEFRLKNSSIYHYLTFLAPPLSDTFFEDILKLEPATVLEIDKNMKLKKYKYFYTQNIFTLNNSHLSFNEIVNTTDKLLEEAIRLRLISDRKVAISLSGGLDSSLNLYYAKKLNKDIYAINITYKGFKNSETKIAKRYAKELGIHLISLEIDTEEYFNVYKELENFIDTPLIWNDMILIYLISKKLKELDIRVLLIGEGGDELGAYQSYFDILEINNKFLKNKETYVNLSQTKPEKFDLLYNNKLISKRHIHGFYENEKKQFLKKHPNSYEFLDNIMDEVDGNFINKILNLEYKFRIPEILLSRIDYATMQNSVEARAPFLDKNLVKFTMSTDFYTRNKDKNPKAVIKELAKRYLPSYIYSEPKKGFGYEFQKLLDNELKTRYINEVINEDNAPIKRYLPLDFLTKNHLSYRIWMLYSLNNWLEKVENV